MGVVRVAGVGGDLAGADLECGEQAGGAVADVVVGQLSGMPWRSGRTGWVQSRAWIWDFSSTLTTTVPAGGSQDGRLNAMPGRELPQRERKLLPRRRAATTLAKLKRRSRES